MDTHLGFQNLYYRRPIAIRPLAECDFPSHPLLSRVEQTQLDAPAEFNMIFPHKLRDASFHSRTCLVWRKASVEFRQLLGDVLRAIGILRLEHGHY